MPERLGPPHETPLFERIALIGLGLIGSSIARAARHLNLARTIVAIDAERVGGRAGARARDRRRGDDRRGCGRDGCGSRHPLRAGRRLRGGGGGHAPGAQARLHRVRCGLGEGLRGRPGAAASAGRRVVRAGASGGGHRAFGTRRGLCDALPQSLVHPHPARGHRRGGRRARARLLGGDGLQRGGHERAAPRPRARHHQPRAAPDRLQHRRHGGGSRDRHAVAR